MIPDYVTIQKNGVCKPCRRVLFTNEIECGFCGKVLIGQSKGTCCNAFFVEGQVKNKLKDFLNGKCCTCGAVITDYGWYCACCGSNTDDPNQLCYTCVLQTQFVHNQTYRAGAICAACGTIYYGIACPKCARNAFNPNTQSYQNNPIGGQPKVTAQAGSVRIWWDNAVAAYRVSTPFNDNFVNFIKSQVPVSDRDWDKPSRIWTVTEKYMEPVKLAAEKAFNIKATVITRQQTEAAGTPSAVAAATLPSIFSEFFDLIPYDAMRRAYLLAANHHHPDRGGSMEKMTKLNALWQRLEKEFYKKEN